jgi:hypothetical protein
MGWFFFNLKRVVVFVSLRHNMNRREKCLFYLLLSVILAGQSCLTTFFGPEVFIRSKGKPITDVREFSTTDFQDPYILHLRNGDDNGKNRVSSANVWLNGEALFEPSDFSQQVWGYDVEVELNEQSILEVKIASKPGSKLKIWIERMPVSITLEVIYLTSA